MKRKYIYHFKTLLLSFMIILGCLSIMATGGGGGGSDSGTSTNTSTSTDSSTSTDTSTSTSSSSSSIDNGTYNGSCIRIESDDDFKTANGVVSGSGTQADPYIIEGWTIDASSCDTSVWPYIASGISIGETSKYFVVRNCTITNTAKYGVGISLGLTSNGKVQNNTISTSTEDAGSGTGISFGGCSNIVISGNKIGSSDDGISSGSYASEGITISGNTITGCSGDGIDFHYLYNSSATDNIITDNKGDGIRASAIYESGCTISGNTVQRNGDGIDVSSSASWVTISGNNISDNGTGLGIWGSNNTISNNTSNGNGVGIYLDYTGLTTDTASNNTLSGNTANGNRGDGIYVGLSCRNNVISNNTALNNNTLNEYYYDGTPRAYDIEIMDKNNTLTGNTYGTIYIQN